MKHKKTFLGTLQHREASSLFFESHQYGVVKSGTILEPFVTAEVDSGTARGGGGAQHGP